MAYASPGLLALKLCVATTLALSPLTLSPQALAQTAAPAVEKPAAASSAREEWRKSMTRVPLPKRGCFKSEYPKVEWVEVPCGAAPNRPYIPPAGPGPEAGGGADDFVATTGNPIASARGSFDSATGLGTETGTTYGNVCQNPTPNVQNTFSLQINTNTFKTNACSKGGSKCLGWQQFVYSNSGNAFIQYWLLNYGRACPKPWKTSGNNCWQNGPGIGGIPSQPVAGLGQLVMTGVATPSGDSVTVAEAGAIYATQTAPDGVLGLAQNWRTAEFNVFGDGCGSRAVFSGGSTVVVRNALADGSANAPTCAGGAGNTAETNNLTTLNPCCPYGGGSPAVTFAESNSAVSLTTQCQSGTSIPATAAPSMEIGVALGRTCGPDRNGHPLHMKYSKNESQCVYLSANANATNCTQKSCCPTVVQAPPGGSTQLWDAANGVCKQGAGTTRLACPGTSALFGIDSYPWILNSPELVATSVVVGYQAAPDGTPSWGEGQTCLSGAQWSNQFSNCHQIGAVSVAAGTAGLDKVPGYNPSYGCVAAFTPEGTDYADPGLH